jgi:hypothetical protein
MRERLMMRSNRQDGAPELCTAEAVTDRTLVLPTDSLRAVCETAAMR